MGVDRRKDELCAVGFHGSRSHGVSMSKRRNRDGSQFGMRPSEDYQEGECSYCDQTVFAVRPTNVPLKDFHPWRAKVYIITEEDTPEDLLAALRSSA
jgi:hypothetical protein